VLALERAFSVTSTTRRAPKGLGPAGRRLWRSIMSEYELDVDDQLVCEEACRALDDLRALEEALDGEDLVVAGSTGQPRAHPLVSHIRSQRRLVVFLVGRLRLPGDLPVEVGSVFTSTSTKARDAARARWDRRGGGRGRASA
jgi:hypothetical protein